MYQSQSRQLSNMTDSDSPHTSNWRGSCELPPMNIYKRISSTLSISFLALAFSVNVQADDTTEKVPAVNSVEQVQAVESADKVVGDDALEQAQADESAGKVEGDDALEKAQADKTIDKVKSRLAEILPGIQISSLEKSTIPGLYELITDGQIYYVDETAEYLVDGSLIRLSDRANMTDARQGVIHAAMIDEISEDDMLIYEPEVPSTRSITVFTDITCGYCRKLHSEIDTLLDAGVRVRYLLFPRAGLGSQGHKDLISVWCADNPQEAMTNAKAGGKIEPKSCDNPIESHVALAERLGLRGTPLIYTDSGEKVPGYREANVLASMVNGSQPLAN